MTKINLLFIGPLNSGSTCNARLQALKDLNNNVSEIDTSKWLSSKYKIINSFVQRTYLSNFIYNINKEILVFIKLKKIQIIWIEKGEYIYPKTLALANKNNIFIINYNTDNIFLKKGHFWLHNLGIKYYNLYLTTNRLNVLDIKNKYNINCFRVAMGYDKNYEDGCNKFIQKKYDVVFVGHWEPSTEESILCLIKNGINVKVWGHNWKNSKYTVLQNVKPLPQKDYVETIASSKIALCFLSKWNKNESTGRTFEIPAIGTLLVAEFTDEHNTIFKDGESAVLFYNNEDLVNKINDLLINSNKRELISYNGNFLIKKLELSWQLNLKREWPSILSFYNKKGLITHNCLWDKYAEGEMPPILK